jgi:predicted N-formylglutamate amidohydrolase
MSDILLAQDEPPAVTELRRDGGSDFVIVVDHASRRLPKKLGMLGLPDSELTRHIAWDIGALAVARLVSERLDAAMVVQNYSRLVIDCNRDPAAESAIPVLSELTAIPGNRYISDTERAARVAEIFTPYQEHIRALLDERQREGRRTILIAQHSMTDLYKGQRRKMAAAVLYNRDPRFARPFREALAESSGAIVADNEPYAMDDTSDFTLPRHGEQRGLPHVGIEIRQDLITDERGQRRWADHVAAALEAARLRF